MSSATLQTALDQIDALIVQITANPKPNYSINGQTIQWGDYLKQLMDGRQSILNQISLSQGPGEVVIEGVT